MAKTANEIVVHVTENVDDATLDDLEKAIRRDNGVLSVARRSSRKHLMRVVYDSEVARATNILHNFQERGLHAQLLGM